MKIQKGFHLIIERHIDEIHGNARLWRHIATGAEFLSLTTDDENKVFGATFRTPPPDSTGVAHILEHSVLCGSKKYPVKEPFVELLKGSLNTFLNALTYPDKTCYPVASTNLQDFYNLVDVYLDAIFFPNITLETFLQESWRLEPTHIAGSSDRSETLPLDSSLAIQGVVYNEMKGVYSSPDGVLAKHIQQSLFPDIAYGLDSGGDPECIPDLTYEAFVDFHHTYYHPSNCRFFFAGDDPEKRRLELLAEVLSGFSHLEIPSAIALQPAFTMPRSLIRSYATGPEEGKGTPPRRAMFTVNWLLPEQPIYALGSEVAQDEHLVLSFSLLDFLLVGLPGSPLRKALIDSCLGEDLAGDGLDTDLRQLFYSIGLKHCAAEDADRIEALIFETLRSLVQDGFNPALVEAALNFAEFTLRENNTGSFPRGFSLMLRCLRPWLHGGDPIAALAYKRPLAALKTRLATGELVFEDLITTHFLENSSRTTLLLIPDSRLKIQRDEAEVIQAKALMVNQGEAGHAQLAKNLASLRRMHEATDSPEALATIPRLKLSDLEPYGKDIPLERLDDPAALLFLHDLPTDGVVYLDLGFNITTVPVELLPLLPLFGHSLLELGTTRTSFVDLSMRIAQKTGGMHYSTIATSGYNQNHACAWLFIRAKSILNKIPNMLDILTEVLTEVDLNNRKRFRQLVLEKKAGMEHKLMSAGHIVVTTRLHARVSETGWLGEMLNGVTQLDFLRTLAQRVDENWDSVRADLAQLHDCLIRRPNALANLTLDRKYLTAIRAHLKSFLDCLPDIAAPRQSWSRTVLPAAEVLTIPTQVNYVGKCLDLSATGWQNHGAAIVAARHLQQSWLWNRIRAQGGAYGVACLLDQAVGTVTLVSYRDPHVDKTLNTFDASAAFLKELSYTLDKEELAKAIIGSIGEIDSYLLPDAKGLVSMIRLLRGDEYARRQRIREQVLTTQPKDFAIFGDYLAQAAATAMFTVLGSSDTLEPLASKRGWALTHVL
ncbi:presequence protease [Desulfovibrionales bacterium]